MIEGDFQRVGFSRRKTWLCSVAVAVIGAGVVTAGAGLASASIGSSAASSAANTQAQSAANAQQLQASEFQQTEGNVQPFVSAGTNALTSLQNLTGTNPGGNPLTAPLSAPFQPTMASLAATPGYQFVLQQGENAAQNSYAAEGLGKSGAAVKGATNYAEGLAGTTYQNQFQNYLAQNQQTYNMVNGIVTQGQNAALGLGTIAQSNANSQSGLITSAGASQAAGAVGAANALTQGLNTVAGAGTNTALLYGLMNSPNSSLYQNKTQTSSNPLSPAGADGAQWSGT